MLVAAADRLTAEANSLRETNASQILGFVAVPVNNCLAHWQITLLGSSFDPSSNLAMQLVEWTMHHNPNLGDSGLVRASDVIVELLIPNNFPERAPVFRVIAPRFRDVNQLNLALSQCTDPEERLTVSRDLEAGQGSWDPVTSMTDLAGYLRARLMNAEVDLDAGKDGSLATVGGFWKSYMCVHPSLIGKEEQEHTGQISLPVSALEQLFGRGGGGRRGMNASLEGLATSGGPMTFEVSSQGGRRSFCGVAEFTADEGTAVVPKWMSSNLGLFPLPSSFSRPISLIICYFEQGCKWAKNSLCDAFTSPRVCI